MTCRHCGEPYYGGGGTVNKRDPSDPDRYRFYRHAERYDDGCVELRGTLMRRVIEPAVIEVIAQVVDRPPVRRAIERALDAALARRTSVAPDHTRRLETRREEVKAEHVRIVSAVGRGVLTDDDARKQLARLSDEEAELSADIERARFHKATLDRFRTERKEIIALATDFRARAARVSGQELRELLRPWIARATVDRAAGRVELAIRQIPAAGPFLVLFNGAEPGSRSCAVAERRSRRSLVPR
jgi:hypothetical protein